MLPSAPHSARASRAVAAVALAALLLALAGCRPEPAPAPTAGATPTSTPTPVASPTPAPTVAPGSDDIALPSTCEAIYSPTMLQSLESQIPPLNDAGVTMNSSQIVEALELLSSGLPTIRCSWGSPDGSGLATNVAIVTPEQTQGLVTALESVGFACDSADDGTLCSLDRTTIDLDDNEVKLGEAHFFRGNGWVSTAWIGLLPDGYMNDIATTLWS